MAYERKFNVGDAYKVTPRYVPDTDTNECLNLGSGQNIWYGFVNLDKIPIEIACSDMRLGFEYVQWDFEHDRGDNGEILPFEDDRFDYILARDVLEHVPHRVPDIKGEFMAHLVMDMIRVTRPGGTWEIISPHRPDCLGAMGHTRLIDESTFQPFTRQRGTAGSGENLLLPDQALKCIAHHNHRIWRLSDPTRFGRSVVKDLWFMVVK